MAKILFVSINDTSTEGLRSMSATLKRAGHEPYIIFFKKYNSGSDNLEERRKIEDYDMVSIDESGGELRICRGPDPTEAEKKLFLSLISEISPDLISFTATAPLKKRVSEISKLVRDNFKTPIIWGGPAPTTDPEGCLGHCDFVVVGEGENVILEVAGRLDQKKELKDIKNLAYSENGQFVKNPVRPLITDLDSIPFKDISPEGKFLIEDNSVKRNFSDARNNPHYQYRIISSRGCPFGCNYCCENFFRKLYSSQVFLRRRSPRNVIEELIEAKRSLNFKYVLFEDEIFSFSYDWLVEFKAMYSEEIDLPFTCYIYPDKDVNRKLAILKEMGLVNTCLAIESGSDRINREVFNRALKRDFFLETARTLKSLDISFSTDVITYNPFEREEDLQATLDILNDIPKSFGISVNKLYVFRSTKMYDLVENLKKREGAQPLAESVFNYYCRLYWLTTVCDKSVVQFIQRTRLFKDSPVWMGYFLILMRVIYKIRRAVQNPRILYTRLARAWK